MLKIAMIVLGGGIGATLRYSLAGLIQGPAGSGFPWGTLAVNALGCFVMGVLATLFSGPVVVREEYRLFLIVGILGGFTTFSAFAWETIALSTGGQRWLAVANVLLSNILCLSAAIAGHLLARLWHGATP
jgi:CrcB protein